MIDTIRLRIKALSDSDISKIKEKLTDKITVDNQTGELIQKFTTGSLLGSYDYRIHISVKDQEYIPITTVKKQQIEKYYPKNREKQARLKALISREGRKAPVLVPCPEYIEIEFSLPKFIYGVNFFNTDLFEDFKNLVRFKKAFKKIMGVRLPPFEAWEVLRLDTAMCYEFVTLDAIREHINAMRNLDYPRRKKPTFYQDSLYIPGSITTLKMYAKQPEFKKHDYKRVMGTLLDKMGIIDDDKKKVAKKRMDQLLEMIEGYFRLEIEWHKRKLRDFEVYNVKDIFQINWVEQMKKEMEKLVGRVRKPRIHSYHDVLVKLQIAKENGYFKRKKATMDTVLSVWTTIVTYGKKEAIERHGKMKVSRVKRILEGLNISLLSNLEDHEIIHKRDRADIRKFEPITAKYQFERYQQIVNL